MDVYRMPEWVQTDYDLELYHHGIKGQRWGVRRYQNSDGSLTNAGRQRYSNDKVIYTNRPKYSTGKSKGVKKRKVAKQDYNFDNNSQTFISKFNPNMKENTLRMTSGTSASGINYGTLYFKDKESAKRFADAFYADGIEGVNDLTREKALRALVQKYGDLEYDVSKAKPGFPFIMFTNISEEEQLMPAMALTDSSLVKTAKVKKENIGKNGMPSDVSEIARKTNYQTPVKRKEKGYSGGAYVKNGAPSYVKKTIYLKPNRRTRINTDPGTHGMPTNINNLNVRRKKK